MGQVVQVQQVSEPYVNEFRALENNHGWAKAELVARWRRETKATDEEIAKALGDTAAATISKLRRTWEDFSEDRVRFRGLSFSHFTHVLGWDDAEVWLTTAHKEGLSVHEMTQKRNDLAAPQGEPKEKPASRGSSKTVTQQEELEPEDDSVDGEDENVQPESPKTEKAPAHAKKTAPTDAVGNVIPVHLRDIFETSRLLMEMEGDLSKSAGEIEATAGDVQDKNPVIANRISVIKNYIENAKREIRYCTPHVVCNHCKGSGCNGCQKLGWLTRDQWKAVKE